MSAEEFLNNVSESVSAELSQGVAELKGELIKVIAAKKLGEISEGRIDAACQLIHNKAKEAFDKNMEKFRIYSARNVFVPSSQAPSSSSSTATPSTETDAHLLELRRRYLELQAELRSVADSCRDTDALLRDMRSALFTLRVGAQAFEEGDMDVAESMGEIAQNRNRLLELCAEANALIAQFTEYEEGPSVTTEASEVMDVSTQETTAPAAAAIETNDVDDILALGRSLKGAK